MTEFRKQHNHYIFLARVVDQPVEWMHKRLRLCYTIKKKTGKGLMWVDIRQKAIAWHFTGMLRRAIGFATGNRWQRTYVIK